MVSDYNGLSAKIRKFNNGYSGLFWLFLTQLYSQPCVKRPFENRQNKDLNDKW